MSDVAKSIHAQRHAKGGEDDLSAYFVSTADLYIGPEPPANPTTGQIWLDTTP